MNIVNISVPAGVASPVSGCGPIPIGYVGENGVTQVQLDFSAWKEAYGEGQVGLEIMRNGDTIPYMAVLQIDGTTAIWTVTDVDTGAKGVGVAGYTYTIGDNLKRSAVFPFFVGRDVNGDPGTRPEPYESFIDQMRRILTDSQAAQAAAEAAEGNAETAQAAAETAQGKAEEAQDVAEAARQAAESARDAAETAQGKAEDAQDAAETARQAAELARDAAAGSAQTAAQQARAAEAAKSAAETAQDKAEDAQDAAETARQAAESARDAAAGSAQTAAQQARAAEEAAQSIQKLWFGTVEEYNNLPYIDPEMVYFLEESP